MEAKVQGGKREVEVKVHGEEREREVKVHGEERTCWFKPIEEENENKTREEQPEEENIESAWPRATCERVSPPTTVCSSRRTDHPELRSWRECCELRGLHKAPRLRRCQRRATDQILESKCQHRNYRCTMLQRCNPS
jgi:hypothetical protein